MPLVNILFWAFFASYVMHILHETLLNGGFVQWIRDNFWPTYHVRMFFWFNAAFLAAIVAGNVLFDSFAAIGSSCRSSSWLGSSRTHSPCTHTGPFAATPTHRACSRARYTSSSSIFDSVRPRQPSRHWHGLRHWNDNRHRDYRRVSDRRADGTFPKAHTLMSAFGTKRTLRG